MDALGMRLAVVVDPTVMAARETSNRVDARSLEGVGELIRVEFRADARDRFRGMEVEVNLSACAWENRTYMLCLLSDVLDSPESLN